MSLEEDLGLQLKKLSPQDFDVLLLQIKSADALSEETLCRIRDWLDQELPGKQLLMLVGDTDLKTMREEDMNQIGWYRKKDERKAESPNEPLEEFVAGV